MCGILKEETRERDEWNRGTVGAGERQNKGGGKSEVEGGEKKGFLPVMCLRGEGDRRRDRSVVASKEHAKRFKERMVQVRYITPGESGCEE